MGITKSEIFTEEQNKLASIAKVLGHPARIAIIQHLIKVNACICGDLVEEIGLAQPTISQHLKELKNIGIIKGNIEGTSICYCIDTANWQAYQKQFASFFDTLPKVKNTKCC
ncbi:DNA-binding transcriptional regulator, ArsR family [Pustulibacterium marinum]|uniref:DNA-binding transcriptional regulator, ArsR family n=1 Tax=Pustulibacterium marinum TaxID=1224947 RepID=A0A1I7F9P5_9FLAO|nr:metalloregulator ArsR/SmtB family transcription factor [Pustulibacterium marinum]SFU32859.1 DNA-binding transcriptional regulator, ArsR family [Pustulibacterium marinum]